MSSGRGRRILLTVLFAAGLVAVVAVLPQLAQWLSGEMSTERGIGGRAQNVSTVQTIRDIDELRTEFNEDAGRVRVFLLLSPT